MVSATSKKSTILILEDEYIQGQDIKQKLIALGYNVLPIAQSLDDVKLILQSQQPDLALLDINIKGNETGGIEVTKHLGDVPHIFVSSHTSQNILDLAKITNAYGYLVKPFSRSALHSAIEVALFKRQYEHTKKVADANELHIQLINILRNENSWENRFLEFSRLLQDYVQFSMLSVFFQKFNRCYFTKLSFPTSCF